MLALPIINDVAEVIAFIATGGALVNGLLGAVTGLRAKSKAKIILTHLQSDSKLSVILNEVKESKRKQSDPEVHRLILETLAKSAGALSNKELKQIEMGLEQPSLTGEIRYVNDIIG